ncbi:VOC family protein [Pedobacter suwonensis]|uniref:VOC family protein n=1 Tax=Pedobacter suwonensis TaxID=332999 RepID=UPI00368BA8D0
MIKGLFETHIYVEDLERSIDFYSNVLGLTQCLYEADRRIAFFWIGKPQEAMLGIWEKPKKEIDVRHFAFRCEVDDVLNNQFSFWNLKTFSLIIFLRVPIMIPWFLPGCLLWAIYFNDPDGHALEFIAILDGEARPELGVVTYPDWLKLNL